MATFRSVTIVQEVLEDVPEHEFDLFMYKKSV